MRARVLAVVAALVAAGLTGPATAAPRARTGRLTADTTVTWQGNAGIRLSVAGGVLPRESMTLFVRGGTYAFVAMLADPQPADCQTATPFSHCYGIYLSKFPGAASFEFTDEAGHDHITVSAGSGRIVGRRLDLYLFTDGEATLHLRPRGYSGRSSYVAGGRVRGLARPLPGSCATVCGETAATTVAAGGVAYDFGRTPGHLVTTAVRSYPLRDQTVPQNHPMSVKSCYYPNVEEPDASADPADHPHGCDLGIEPAGDPGLTAYRLGDSAHVGVARYHLRIAGGQVGRRYIGFRVAGAWVERGWNLGYGLWFSYGIT